MMPPAAALLTWYDRHRRAMPWRALPGQAQDPYRVWLSEIMLQQTTVAAVAPYYERFLARFPDVHALAAAPEDSVMQAWAGLGYYARARNLHACAKAVAAAGAFPDTIEGLRALPGIGPYTAAAIASIAFAIPAVPVDGNVERVAARVFAIEAPLPAARPAIAAAAARLGDDADARARPADFTQALFDLGATVCTPTSPACVLCPWREGCAARARGIAADLPRKAPRRARPLRHGVHFWLTDAQGQALLRRRPPDGLLGGMVELPGTPLARHPLDRGRSPRPRPPSRPTGARPARRGTASPISSCISRSTPPRPARSQPPGLLRPLAALEQEALPSVMRKCLRALGVG